MGYEVIDEEGISEECSVTVTEEVKEKKKRGRSKLWQYTGREPSKFKRHVVLLLSCAFNCLMFT